MSAIVRKGWLRRDPMRSRGLALVDGPPAAEPRRVIALDDATVARCAALLTALTDPRAVDAAPESTRTAESVVSNHEGT